MCIRDRLTFTEAMELCNFGAKFIYPPTIYPVYHKNIPIRILNTFNPEAPGTYISKEKVKEEGKAIIKGISSINDTCLITVQGLGMVGVIGVNYRIFKTLAKSGISVFMVSQASSENNTTCLLYPSLRCFNLTITGSRSPFRDTGTKFHTFGPSGFGLYTTLCRVGTYLDYTGWFHRFVFMFVFFHTLIIMIQRYDKFIRRLVL